MKSKQKKYKYQGKFYTLKELKSLLGYSEFYIKKLISENKLDTVKDSKNTNSNTEFEYNLDSNGKIQLLKDNQKIDAIIENVDKVLSSSHSKNIKISNEYQDGSYNILVNKYGIKLYQLFENTGTFFTLGEIFKLTGIPDFKFLDVNKKNSRYIVGKNGKIKLIPFYNINTFWSEELRRDVKTEYFISKDVYRQTSKQIKNMSPEYLVINGKLKNIQEHAKNHKNKSLDELRNLAKRQEENNHKKNLNNEKYKVNGKYMTLDEISLKFGLNKRILDKILV